jgi:hypothetical protein
MIFCLELFGLFVTATPQSHLIEHRPETTFPSASALSIRAVRQKTLKTRKNERSHFRSCRPSWRSDWQRLL